MMRKKREDGESQKTFRAANTVSRGKDMNAAK
jgi:hypothetical protein